jgi:hypothetical protein
MMEKFGQAAEGWGHAHPLSLYLPSRPKLHVVYAPAERVDRYTPPISTLHLYVLCGYTHQKYLSTY